MDLAAIISKMTLAEKIGQMTQVEKNSITPEQVGRFGIGSVLSGGGAAPEPNTPAAWASMVDGYQQGALQSRLKIPLLYGVDAVHGHNNLQGAVLFPHNIGLGASLDADLVERIGRATAEALVATGIRWNFAPMVAVVDDLRWGRTFECFGADTGLVAMFGRSYLQGLQGKALGDAHSVLATPKHYIGDGGTRFGSSTTLNMTRSYLLDQGDTQMTETELLSRFLAPYQAAIQAGAQAIMVTHSSWNGTRVLADHHLLTEVLKQNLGFSGFLVSDWESVNLIDADYGRAVIAAVNAGVDMVMVPYDYPAFIHAVTSAVEQCQIAMSRIDDAVRRILKVKSEMGLFERPFSEPSNIGYPLINEHRMLAREAVSKSLVLLKNERTTLPLAKSTASIQVGGAAAHDIGMQCGGWSIQWQGQAGAITPGTTLLDGIRQLASGRVEHDLRGEFAGLADIGIAFVGEPPYAEGHGDREDLRLSNADRDLILRMRQSTKRLVVVVVAGRPLVFGDLLDSIDALVAAWLPGTEGAGLAEALFGDYPFSANLPVNWPADDLGRIQWQMGFGLTA